ncbi:hypothetical protein LITTLEE_125 [Mycobacterium phage LittleE]|uniref:Uncharacterized protein n=1 Tax=Mycobacterium phage LittleE TaxID=2922212 RepID=G1D410_9CAUD|nr:tail fiber protein [Mycobacterium phage LittleE]AEK09505.1 hypothetical protein LITTLEE_125 [Mycobacterium phage LittleE]
MSTETVSVTELEEMLSDEIPCGGTRRPTVRDCPNQATAILACRHALACHGNRSAMKCFSCYSIWLQAALDDGRPVRCSCGWSTHATEVYTPL